MVLCEHCESGIKYLPHWVLLKKVNDFGQLYYLPQTLHCPIAVLSETCALASRPELLEPWLSELSELSESVGVL